MFFGVHRTDVICGIDRAHLIFSGRRFRGGCSRYLCTSVNEELCGIPPMEVNTGGDVDGRKLGGLDREDVMCRVLTGADRQLWIRFDSPSADDVCT